MSIVLELLDLGVIFIYDIDIILIWLLLKRFYF